MVFLGLGTREGAERYAVGVVGALGVGVLTNCGSGGRVVCCCWMVLVVVVMLLVCYCCVVAVVVIDTWYRTNSWP